MKFFFGETDKLFPQFAEMKHNGYLLAPNQFRKKQLSEKWLDFCKNYGKDTFLYQQKLKILTINGFVYHFDSSEKRIVSIPEQLLLIKHAIDSLKELPEEWRSVSSLSSIFRKAYSINEFDYLNGNGVSEEKHYGSIRRRYLELLSQLKMTDIEQNLQEALNKFVNPKNAVIFVEYFPSATMRINYLYRFLNDISSTFIIPPFLSGEKIGLCKNFDHFEAKVSEIVMNDPLVIDQPYSTFNSTIDEVSAQLDFHQKNPDTTFIMTDSANYRLLYEQLSLLRYKKPLENRQSIVSSIFYEFFTTIINCLSQPQEIENWLALFSSRYNYFGSSVEEEILINRYISKLKSTSYIRKFGPHLDFPFYKKPSFFGKSFDSNELEKLNLNLEKWIKLMKKMMALSNFHSDPAVVLGSISEIIKKYHIPASNNLLIRQQNEFLKVLKSLKDIYSQLHLKKTEYTRINRDVKNFCSAVAFDYFPLYTNLNVLALEDYKNLAVDGDVWISGFNQDNYPPREGVQNFWLSQEQQDRIYRLRQTEQKAALMFLLKEYPDRLKISCSIVVNGLPRQASLVLYGNRSSSETGSRYFPFIKNTNLSEADQRDEQKVHRITRFSASSLNTFLKCPQQYFWKYIAVIPEPLEVEPDISNAEVGSILHRVLQLLFNDKRVVESLNEIKDVDKVYENLKRTLNNLIPGVISENPARIFLQDELNRSYLHQWFNNEENNLGSLFRFLKSHLTYFYNRQQEQKYIGIKRIDTEAKLSVTRDDLTFVGKIDRLDIYCGEDKGEIWDYKSGNVSTKTMEELELTDIQRGFYSFLIRKSVQYALKSVQTHFQPLTGAKLEPTPDHNLVLSDKLKKLIKNEVINEQLFVELNTCCYRIREPQQIIISRLNKEDLPTHDILKAFKDDLHALSIAEKNRICESLLSDLQNMDATSDQFIVWLAKRSNQGPFPGISGRTCDYCAYISICDTYRTEKPNSEEYSNE